MYTELMGWALQEHKFWEESFKVYEKGVAIFKYPHVRDIWLAYLQQFVKRYGGTKLERARDLFKQALRQVECPSTCMHMCT
jgi:pre-mRNA-splicing factor SYF1